MQAGARNSLDQGGCESLGWEMGAGVDVGAALTSGIPGQVVKVEYHRGNPVYLSCLNTRLFYALRLGQSGKNNDSYFGGRARG